MLYIPQSLRECTQCHQWLPLTRFYRHKGHGDGLRRRCIQCFNNPLPQVKTPAYSRLCSQKDNCVHPNGPILPLSEFNKRNRRCKKCAVAIATQWVNKNSEWVKERNKRYYAKHRIYSRVYYIKHSEHIKQQVRKYRDSHIAVVDAAWRRYRARTLALPATFTGEDWQHALDYFHGACVYCGHGPSMFDYNFTLHQDHFIAVSKGGGYTPDNILPSCERCNLNKGNSDPHEWLTQRFGKRKANQILKRIQAYFDWVKNHS